MGNHSQIAILGHGGTADELATYIKQQGFYAGFFCDFSEASDSLGTLEDATKERDSIKLISGLGSYRKMNWRRETLSKFPIYRFTNFICQSVILHQSLEDSRDIVIFPFSVVGPNVTLGKHILVYHSCIISHDVCIENYVIVSNRVTISGNVKIGANSYIGAGATIIDHVCIGENCIVASGANVVKDVPSNTIYFSKDKVIPNYFNIK